MPSSVGGVRSRPTNSQLVLRPRYDVLQAPSHTPLFHTLNLALASDETLAAQANTCSTFLAQRAQAYKADYEKMRTERDAALQRVAQLERLGSLLRTHYNTLHDQHAKLVYLRDTLLATLTSFEEEKENLSAKITALEVALDGLQTERDALCRGNAELQAIITFNTKSLDDLEQRWRAAQAEHQRLEEDHNVSLQTNAALCSSIVELKNTIATLEEEKKKLADEATGIVSSGSSLSTTLGHSDDATPHTESSSDTHLRLTQQKAQIDFLQRKLIGLVEERWVAFEDSAGVREALRTAEAELERMKASTEANAKLLETDQTKPLTKGELNLLIKIEVEKEVRARVAAVESENVHLKERFAIATNELSASSSEILTLRSELSQTAYDLNLAQLDFADEQAMQIKYRTATEALMVAPVQYVLAHYRSVVGLCGDVKANSFLGRAVKNIITLRDGGFDITGGVQSSHPTKKSYAEIGDDMDVDVDEETQPVYKRARVGYHPNRIQDTPLESRSGTPYHI